MLGTNKVVCVVVVVVVEAYIKLGDDCGDCYHTKIAH